MATSTVPTIDLLTLTAVPQNGDSMVPCAVRIHAPADVARVPTHILLMLDISDSMRDHNKLENCKRCALLMLNVLSPGDKISLITFGEQATLHLKRVPADDAHKETITKTIQGLQTDGCTNLSAGLGYVRECCEGDTQKAGLLILTDGHANRGVSGTTELRAIASSLRESFSNLSIHAVAYGTDHNEQLLRGIAEDVQGSYNVVSTIEDTAFAFGDTLGGLMSCAFQNVKLELPEGSVVHGPHKIVDRQIRIGDVYAGTKPLVLVDIPSAACRTESCVKVTGMSLPLLTAWTAQPVQTMLTDRDKDIELTKLRYNCTSILKDCSASAYTMTNDQRTALRQRITDFETAITDTFFDGHAVAGMLRREVAVMRDLLAASEAGGVSHAQQVLAAQHTASIGLSRGFSSPAPGPTPSAPSGRVAPRHYMRRQGAAAHLSSAHAGDGDPNTYTPQGSPTLGGVPGEATPPGSPHLGAAAGGAVPEAAEADTSCFQNTTQQRIATLMRTASQQPY